MAAIQPQIGRHTLVGTSAMSFLTAHPAVVNRHAANLRFSLSVWKIRHDTFVKVLGTHLFKAAGVGVGYDVKYKPSTCSLVCMPDPRTFQRTRVPLLPTHCFIRS
eukprot:GFKZ01014771.1.p3 GENE.GFKZ01014771.1~~GFKZ01014771.1.p3  ORF type:complete len:105 (-),score=5.33 GFKZ01014771.1:570-884(-)